MNQLEINRRLYKVERSPVWRRAEAFVIIPPQLSGQIRPCLAVGRIKIALPMLPSGLLEAWLWDVAGTPVQYGSCEGYGFDKLSVALAGLTFDGIELIDSTTTNWEAQLRNLGYAIHKAL